MPNNINPPKTKYTHSPRPHLLPLPDPRPIITRPPTHNHTHTHTYKPPTHSSTLHQWSRPDPAYLLEEHERKERKQKAPPKPWYTYLLESAYKRDPYPDSKLAQLLLALEINRRAKVCRWVCGWVCG
jgi:hypothetical protein